MSGTMLSALHVLSLSTKQSVQEIHATSIQRKQHRVSKFLSIINLISGKRGYESILSDSRT